MKKFITLKNGLNILYYPMENTHSVTFGLYVKAGLGYNDEKKQGITHFLEHLHFRRLGDISQNELYYKMECMGSTLRASTYKDFLKFSMKIIPEYLEQILEIFVHIINAMEWTDEEFEREKQVVINQILERGDYLTLGQEVNKVVFKDHVLSENIMGSIDSVKSISIDDIKEYKKECFKAPNILVCITGNVKKDDFDIAKNVLQNLSLECNQNKKIIQVPKRFFHRKPDITFALVKDDNPLEIDLSFDLMCEKIPKEYVTILNCILGEGVGSRLQKCIREEKGYTSDVASYIEWYKGFGVLHITFSLEKKLLLPCLRDVIGILNEMKREISKHDLDVSLPFYITNSIFYEDDTEEKNFQLGYNAFILECEENYQHLCDEQESIIRLQECAKTIFVTQNASCVILGNTYDVTKKSIRTILGELQNERFLDFFRQSLSNTGNDEIWS